MITKYKAYGRDTIEKVTLEKETELCVWYVTGKRALKHSAFFDWYDTFEEAKNRLIKMNEEIIERKVESLNNSYDVLNNLRKREGV